MIIKIIAVIILSYMMYIFMKTYGQIIRESERHIATMK